MHDCPGPMSDHHERMMVRCGKDVNARHPIGQCPHGQSAEESAVAEPLRERAIPMITDALSRVPLLGLKVVAWDFVYVLPPQGGTLIAGFACAVRGVDVVGPNKELARMQPFDTWVIDQQVVDKVVFTCIEALREFRARQARG